MVEAPLVLVVQVDSLKSEVADLKARVQSAAVVAKAQSGNASEVKLVPFFNCAS